MENGFSIGLLLKNKWVKLGIAFNVIILIIIIIVAINSAQKTATLKIDLAPSDAEVLLGGQKYVSGAYQIKPGEYKTVISREGMTPKEFTINVDGNSVTNLITFLSDNGSFDYYTLAGNYGSFYNLSQMASSENNVTTDQDKSAEEFISKFQDAYASLQTALPIYYSEYETLEHSRILTTDITIKRGEEGCTKTLCVEALILTTGDRDGKSLANEMMINKGMKVEDYEIIYRTY